MRAKNLSVNGVKAHEHVPIPGARRIGFVGLGDMGGPIARRIAAAGFPLTVWARRASAFSELGSEPYDVATSLADLGRERDLVGLCVFGDDDVRQVAVGPDGLVNSMPPGSVLLIHSTVSAELCIELASIASERGVHVVDAPVSGARAAAIRGELTIMLGGQTALAPQVMPVLETYGRVIRWMGPLGSGQITKALNNVLGFGTGHLANLAIETGVALELDPDALIDVLTTGSGGSFALNSLVNVLMKDTQFAMHAAKMIEKDTQLFQRACRTRGVAPTKLEEMAVARIAHITPRIRLSDSKTVPLSRPGHDDSNRLGADRHDATIAADDQHR
jgi:3-hydroxyisobutyrate dehydrogenase-like beta-hydroxyacid dehydrogenase